MNCNSVMAIFIKEWFYVYCKSRMYCNAYDRYVNTCIWHTYIYSAIKDLCEYGFEESAMMAFVTSIPLLVIGIATTLFGLGIITIV